MSAAEEDVNVAEVLRFLWSRKWLVLALTAAATLAGAAKAMLTPRVYQSSVILAPRETQQMPTASNILSSLGGGYGDVLSATLGVGNTDLDRIAIIAKTWETAASVVEANPGLERLFPERWDAAKGAWLPGDDGKAAPPTREEAVDRLQGLIQVGTVNNSFINLSANAHDPLLARDIVDWYVKALNDRIRADVTADAEGNRMFLEKQAANTMDPLIQQKIQGMISVELERTMLISSRSFDVLKRPLVPKRPIKPNRKLIVGGFGAAGLVFGVLAVFLLQFSGNLRARFAGAAAASRAGAGA